MSGGKQSFLARLFGLKSSTTSQELSFPRIDIPEPTKSLLWISNDDPSTIRHAGVITITINISVEEDEVKADVHAGKESGLEAEPSMIWVKLPRQVNNELETRPMYYPSYSGLSPIHRYQYLMWLTDITKPTNLSYVFLYYYGLERHLLIGSYEGAVEEIKRLLHYHDKGTFRTYAARALLTASLHRKRPDILQKIPTLLDETSNLGLVTRVLAKLPFRPEDIISASYRAGFTNKRYLKLQPELFTNTLRDILNEYEKEYGSLSESIDISKLPTSRESLFANLSIPEKYSEIEIPQLVEDGRFLKLVFGMLTTAHERVKEVVSKKRKS